MTDPSVVYVTYIAADPERVWAALTDPELTAAYWGHRNESDGWQVGDRWDHVRTDGSTTTDGAGTVEESDRPRRLGGGAVEPQVAPGDRARAAPPAVGDVPGLTTPVS